MTAIEHRYTTWQTYRLVHARCPMCGGAQVSYVQTGVYVGMGYERCNGWGWQDNEPGIAPYIAPGKPGSHDQPTDYVTEESVTDGV